MPGATRSSAMSAGGSAKQLLVLLLLLAAVADRPALALDCYQCGQYNEGVGSITPCLIYSEPLDKEHMKKCPRESDKYCIKYVSELSVVRDCVAECKEKEVWETRTYCCTEDGCNHAAGLRGIPFAALAALSVAVFLVAGFRPTLSVGFPLHGSMASSRD